MADTVKKSRIVSDEDENLEEALLEEFNMRLKSMSEDNLQQHTNQQLLDDALYENICGDLSPISKSTISTQSFLETERQHHYDVPKSPVRVPDLQTTNGQHHDETSENIYETLPEFETMKTEPSDQYDTMLTPTSQKPNVDLDVSPVSPEITIEKISHEDCQVTVTSNESDVLDSSYEIVEPEELDRPNLSLERKPTDDMTKSVKDRMFLATDDAAATLLFTQTVTSPMLTPSEENIDFLKGFQRDVSASESSTSKDSPHDSNKNSEENSVSESVTEAAKEAAQTQSFVVENIYENTEFIIPKKENLYENLEDCKNLTDSIYENLTEPKASEDLEEAIEEHEEHIYQDIEDCKKEGVYEEVSNVKVITSHMISDEIMVENSLYNNLDEFKMRKVEEMVTDLDLNEDSVDPDKIYETIKTSEEVSVLSEHYDTVLNHTEVVNTHSNTSHSETIVSYTESVKELDISDNHQDPAENFMGVAQVDREIIKEYQSESTERYSQITENVSESSQITENVLESSQNQSVVVENNTNKVEKIETIEYKPRIIDEGKAQGDGLSKVLVESNIGRDSEISSLDSSDKTKETYSEFIHHSKTESNYYEKYTKVVSSSAKNTEICNREKDTETVPPEIVKTLKSQFSKPTSQVSTSNRKEVEDANELRAINIMKQINKFENKDSNQPEVSTVTECYTETTTFQSDVPGEKAFKKKKTKKTRKEEKENISVNDDVGYGESVYNVNVKNLKSSFNKFDALQKKNALQVRSSDAEKAQEKLSDNQYNDSNSCKACSKQVFQMELIKAEKAVWHKNCFRCTECNKQLTVETYASHEGNLYCKPHFKSLFAPRVVEDDAPPSDKPDLGLEELQKLNVKERFQVFENYQSESQETDRSTVNPVAKKSPSILSKLAKFQSKGMDVGVTDDAFNGIPIEESSEEEEEEEEVPEGEDPTLYKARKAQKEKPFHFTNINEVKNKWEQGEQNSKDERREERKQEIQSIRSKLFMGKQVKMKEAYQQAVIQSESCANIYKPDEKIESCDTKSLKERFEKGELFTEKEQKAEDEENEVYQSEISKKSRSLFLELDANASKAPQISPVTPQKLDVKKARETETPEREIYHDPEVVRSEDYVDDSVIAKTTHTASKMLSKFRQMEENLTKEPEPAGPKPLKRFTPPPEPARKEESSEEESGSEEEEEEDQTDNQKLPEDLIEAQKAARAKHLRAKFEKWEAEEIKREQSQSVNIVEEYGEESQVESAKSLRARFESMRDSSSDKSRTPRVKVNRFV